MKEKKSPVPYIKRLEIQVMALTAENKRFKEGIEKSPHDYKTFDNSKDEIIKALLSFDSREPDKTISLWEIMAEWLYKSQELKPKITEEKK